MSSSLINVNEISKVYKLYDKPIDRLKESIHPFRKKYHKDFHALNRISFDIQEGETVGIIGRNGAGKSTLLKLITGVLTPTSGEINVNGKVSALLELGAGFNPELSGMENIYFNGMIMGYSREQMDNNIDDILSFADIGEHINQPVKTYSSGMFVRLAFSVSVSVKPEILIVDEALSVGDVRFRQKAIRKMKSLMSDAKAILFVTHDMESIKNFCTDVIWLKDGQVFERGKPKDIIQRYYNYMLHDILPAQKENDVIAEKTNDLPKDNLQWEEVDHCEVVGGQGIHVKRVTFYNRQMTEKVDIMDGTEKYFTFLAEIEIKQDIEEPLIGFGVFNQYGVPVVHYNTASIKEGENTRKLTLGETVTISFDFEMPKLQSGVYTVSFGVNDGVLGNNIVVQHIRECYIIKIAQSGVEAKQQGLVIVEDAEISIQS
jgi:ABC-type polysaccharide/polyol phosphate transport system ATPase subunit